MPCSCDGATKNSTRKQRKGPVSRLIVANHVLAQGLCPPRVNAANSHLNGIDANSLDACAERWKATRALPLLCEGMFLRLLPRSHETKAGFGPVCVKIELRV